MLDLIRFICLQPWAIPLFFSLCDHLRRHLLVDREGLSNRYMRAEGSLKSANDEEDNV